MKALILAAGKGVRLRPITESQPKAMVKLGGKPLLAWQLSMLKKAGIKEVAIVVGHKREAIEKYFGKEWNGIKITYIFQEKQEGTAHAIGLAKEFAGDEKFVVVYCDVVVEPGLVEELAKEDVLSDYEVLMVGRRVNDPWRYGVLAVIDEQVIGIIEKPELGKEPSNIVNAGLYQFSPAIFEAISKTPRSVRGEYEITDSIRMLAKQGKVGLLKVYDGVCFDIGDAEDLAKAEKGMKALNWKLTA